MSRQVNSSLRSYQVIRVTCLALGAFAVVASAMAIKGCQVVSVMLASLILLVGALLVIQVTRSLRALKRQSLTFEQAALQAEEHYLTVLQRIIKFVEGRDKYTQGRSQRIGRLCEAMSRKLGLSDQACRLMNLAGQLHDIGLLAVPDGVLSKKANFGVGDYRSVQRHSEVSYEVLRPLRIIQPVLLGVRYHHERMNGTGYPSGLSHDALPMEARILAVADAYDAMTHDRPHRSAMTPLDAMRELHRCTPAGFDARCVEALSAIDNLPQLEAAMTSATGSPAEAVTAA